MPSNADSRQRNQVFEIKLGRHLEQDAAAVTLPPGRGLHCPGRITRGELQFAGMGRFILQPQTNLSGIGKFAERRSDTGCQLGFERRSVDGCGFFGLYLGHCTALHEHAFAAVQRRQLMMALGQCPHLRFDAEQTRQKILEMRRQRDQQFRLRLAGQVGGGFSRAASSCARKAGSLSPSEFEESRIDTDQPGTVVKIAECEPVSKAQVLMMRSVMLNSLHDLYSSRISVMIARYYPVAGHSRRRECLASEMIPTGCNHDTSCCLTRRQTACRTVQTGPCCDPHL